MESKFKIGDTVRCIDTDGSYLAKIGAIYKVQHIDINIQGILIHTVKGPCMYEHRFELVEQHVHPSDEVFRKFIKDLERA